MNDSPNLKTNYFPHICPESNRGLCICPVCLCLLALKHVLYPRNYVLWPIPFLERKRHCFSDLNFPKPALLCLLHGETVLSPSLSSWWLFMLMESVVTRVQPRWTDIQKPPSITLCWTIPDLTIYSIPLLLFSLKFTNQVLKLVLSTGNMQTWLALWVVMDPGY